MAFIYFYNKNNNVNEGIFVSVFFFLEKKEILVSKTDEMS
jgi:hypothetical protein